jgi:hypothetical protein
MYRSAEPEKSGDTMSEEQTTQSNHTTHLECPPAKDPAVRWFIFAAMMLGVSVWCFFDRRQPPEAWDWEHINPIANYLLNNWGPVIFVPVGLYALFMAVRQLRRTVVADAEGIAIRGGKRFAWSEITKVDASKLKTKGIVYLFAGEREMKLDSWKIERFKELVRFIEEKVPVEAEKVAPVPMEKE